MKINADIYRHVGLEPSTLDERFKILENSPFYSENQKTHEKWNLIKFMKKNRNSKPHSVSYTEKTALPKRRNEIPNHFMPVPNNLSTNTAYSGSCWLNGPLTIRNQIHSLSSGVHCYAYPPDYKGKQFKPVNGIGHPRYHNFTVRNAYVANPRMNCCCRNEADNFNDYHSNICKASQVNLKRIASELHPKTEECFRDPYKIIRATRLKESPNSAMLIPTHGKFYTSNHAKPKNRSNLEVSHSFSSGDGKTRDTRDHFGISTMRNSDERECARPKRKSILDTSLNAYDLITKCVIPAKVEVPMSLSRKMTDGVSNSSSVSEVTISTSKENKTNIGISIQEVDTNSPYASKKQCPIFIEVSKENPSTQRKQRLSNSPSCSIQVCFPPPSNVPDCILAEVSTEAGYTEDNGEETPSVLVSNPFPTFRQLCCGYSPKRVSSSSDQERNAAQRSLPSVNLFHFVKPILKKNQPTEDVSSDTESEFCPADAKLTNRKKKVQFVSSVKISSPENFTTANCKPDNLYSKSAECPATVHLGTTTEKLKCSRTFDSSPKTTYCTSHSATKKVFSGDAVTVDGTSGAESDEIAPENTSCPSGDVSFASVSKTFRRNIRPSVPPPPPPRQCLFSSPSNCEESFSLCPQADTAEKRNSNVNVLADSLFPFTGDDSSSYDDINATDNGRMIDESASEVRLEELDSSEPHSINPDDDYAEACSLDSSISEDTLVESFVSCDTPCCDDDDDLSQSEAQQNTSSSFSDVKSPLYHEQLITENSFNDNENLPRSQYTETSGDFKLTALDHLPHSNTNSDKIEENPSFSFQDDDCRRSDLVKRVSLFPFDASSLQSDSLQLSSQITEAKCEEERRQNVRHSGTCLLECDSVQRYLGDTQSQTAFPSSIRIQYHPENKEKKVRIEIDRKDSGFGSVVERFPRAKQRNSSREDFTFCEDCDDANEVNINDNGILYDFLVCRKCAKRRQERKEIIMEIAETEVKYGRDLKIIRDEFYGPMLAMGLLSSQQLDSIFLNLPELIDINMRFANKLKDSIELASDQGDDELCSVDIGLIFLEEAEVMLRSFQHYCMCQSAASYLLTNLEKEKEILRIFLRVSQMENTLLRRMNLSSFLMVPVQRITKYPLLLGRLYQVTPCQHISRQNILKAQQKIEIHLDHINSTTKNVANGKLWHRISINSFIRRSFSEQDFNNNLRKISLEALEWSKDEVNFILEGRLLFMHANETINMFSLPRKNRLWRLTSIYVALVVLGKVVITINTTLMSNMTVQTTATRQ